MATTKQPPARSETAPLGLFPALFWDVDLADLDVEKNARWIIGRTVERGGLADWKRVRSHYGDQRMIDAVTTMRELSPQSVALCCMAFDLNKEDFQCCTSRPFPRAPWVY